MSVLVNGLRWVIMATIPMAIFCALAISLRIYRPLALVTRIQLTAPWFLMYLPPIGYRVACKIRMISLWLIAFSIRLAGKSLMTTIIQCSDFYEVDEDGKRRDSGDDSGNHSTGARILTPLCTIARPLVWSREPLYEHRRERFKCIREHFYALVDSHQPTRTEPSHKFINRQRKDTAIEFFSELFGRKHLKNFIGDITFFNRFPDAMETGPLNDFPPVNAADAMRCNLLKGGRQFTTAESNPEE
ncbi:hypothetical protein EDD15DRAFT_1884407 [Pisolithus albus]|nr:hypothetical protein EDD15DRAFT_1884407 [Pisolithus albus]